MPTTGIDDSEAKMVLRVRYRRTWKRRAMWLLGCSFALAVVLGAVVGGVGGFAAMAATLAPVCLWLVLKQVGEARFVKEGFDHWQRNDNLLTADKETLRALKQRRSAAVGGKG